MTDAVEIRYKSRKFRRGELAGIIAELPKRLKAPVLRFAAEKYLNYFKLYPRYKYVTRARAYGMQAGGLGWFSAKQRRYVMARIRDGSIRPGENNRSFETKDAWHIEGRGVEIAIVNDKPSSIFLYDNERQARQTGLVGWEKIDQMYNEIDNRVIEQVWDYVIDLADKQLENIMTGR